ncbi:hypothetical protein HanXRQr2_Chr07g0290101 [Helianthus annuus]|uniref:Uncharacterized protein n=1 Tax=Helianthus annuus TaxID=4232 RepID=A0A9K3IKQ6_HELAN|nr:hypothetical protein HanXRQr2_Chr07g0290101 [Helianthus annuus]KAJ0904326.1 hypothetical protein HanPSC8_Chr07g0280821 [Helianthus annuus]
MWESFVKSCTTSWPCQGVSAIFNWFGAGLSTITLTQAFNISINTVWFTARRVRCCIARLYTRKAGDFVTCFKSFDPYLNFILINLIIRHFCLCQVS